LSIVMEYFTCGGQEPSPDAFSCLFGVVVTAATWNFEGIVDESDDSDNENSTTSSGDQGRGRGPGNLNIKCVVPPHSLESHAETSSAGTYEKHTVPFFLLWHGAKLDVFGRVSTTTAISHHQISAGAKTHLGGGNFLAVKSASDRHVAHHLMYTYTGEGEYCSCAAGYGTRNDTTHLDSMGYPEWMRRVNEYRPSDYQCGSCGVR
jgi:hypothetical protein